MQSHLVVHSWEIYHPGFGILLIPFIVILQYFENHFNYSNLRRLIKMQNISIMFIKCWLRWDEVWAENLKREQLHVKMSTPDTWSGVHQIFFLSIAFFNIWTTPDKNCIHLYLEYSRYCILHQIVSYLDESRY